MLLSMAISGKMKEGKLTLNKAASEIDRILKKENISKIKKLSDLLKNCENLYVIGRGFSYASALEAALKIKEVSYIHAEGLAGGELKHGPIALISKGSPCIVFAPSDETYSAIISNATEIKARGGYIIGISERNDPVFDFHIEVRGEAEVAYIAQNVPVQILAYYLAIGRGLDPDKPRNLAKSVTVK
jgi:glucosamine--fructose-6-phosphate aminotransferase (isomerizing)